MSKQLVGGEGCRTHHGAIAELRNGKVVGEADKARHDLSSVLVFEMKAKQEEGVETERELVLASAVLVYPKMRQWRVASGGWSVLRKGRGWSLCGAK